jgi:ribosomal protein S18 acetylase RimI-like enzyme
MLTFRKATKKDIELLRSLAREIWFTCYPNIISEQQIEYMLDLMYSYKSIEQELQNDVQWFILEEGTMPIGFLAFTVSDVDIKLNKLYLKAGCQGKGFGKAGLQYVIGYAKENHCMRVYLTVNKNNAQAIKAYEKAGFVCTSSVVNDIGGGYVMDDYIYSYELR